jgi:Ser/Thr protein kinase RdoA (MazF antagonist)
LVDTTRGSYFQKKHHPAVVRRWVHEYQKRLATAGLPVLQPLGLIDGNTWYEHQDWLAEVFDAVDAKPPESVDINLARRMAEITALVSRELAEADIPSNAGWFDRGEYTMILDKLEFRASGRVLPSLIAEIRNQIGLMCQRVERFLAVGPPVGPVHGDLWLGNWLVRGGDVAALVDFDTLHVGPRLGDLADVLCSTATGRDLIKRDWRDLSGLDYGRTKVVFDGYVNIVGPLLSEEKSAFEHLVMDHWWRHILIEFVSLDQSFINEAALESVLSTANSIRRELNEVTGT